MFFNRFFKECKGEVYTAVSKKLFQDFKEKFDSGQLSMPGLTALPISSTVFDTFENPAERSLLKNPKLPSNLIFKGNAYKDQDGEEYLAYLHAEEKTHKDTAEMSNKCSHQPNDAPQSDKPLSKIDSSRKTEEPSGDISSKLSGAKSDPSVNKASVETTNKGSDQPKKALHSDKQPAKIVSCHKSKEHQQSIKGDDHKSSRSSQPDQLSSTSNDNSNRKSRRSSTSPKANHTSKDSKVRRSNDHSSGSGKSEENHHKSRKHSNSPRNDHSSKYHRSSYDHSPNGHRSNERPNNRHNPYKGHSYDRSSNRHTTQHSFKQLPHDRRASDFESKGRESRTDKGDKSKEERNKDRWNTKSASSAPPKKQSSPSSWPERIRQEPER